MDVCIYTKCVWVPAEARGKYWIPWSYSYRLATKLGSFGRTASTLTAQSSLLPLVCPFAVCWFGVSFLTLGYKISQIHTFLVLGDQPFLQRALIQLENGGKI